MNLVSPNEMFKASKEMMLGGKDPVTYYDWVNIINFWAANLHKDLLKGEMPALMLLCKMYECPLEKSQILSIGSQQYERRIQSENFRNGGKDSGVG